MRLLFGKRVFFILALCFAITVAKQQLRGKVIGIADGDTFPLLTNEKQQFRIRVYGIDCPEYKQAFGQVARKLTSDFIFKKQVYIVVKDTDKYGRTLVLYMFCSILQTLMRRY